MRCLRTLAAMSRPLAALVLAALAGLTALLLVLAAVRPPRLRAGMPYAEARAGLIARGYEPVRVYRRRYEFDRVNEPTPAYPELLGCSRATQNCGLLFQRRSDGKLYIAAIALGGGSAPEGRAAAGQTFQAFRLTRGFELDGYEIATADGKRRYKVCFPDLPASPYAPLCSAASGRKACWPPDPPPGARPAAGRCPPSPAPPPPEPPDHGRKPRIALGTPYPEARRQLMAQGFDPVRIVAWGPGQQCGWTVVCDKYKETFSCAGDAPLCEFLYRRRSDGRYWSVETRGEPIGRGNFRAMRYAGAGATGRDEGFDQFVIGRDGRRVGLQKELTKSR